MHVCIKQNDNSAAQNDMLCRFSPSWCIQSNISTIGGECQPFHTFWALAKIDFYGASLNLGSDVKVTNSFSKIICHFSFMNLLFSLDQAWCSPGPCETVFHGRIISCRLFGFWVSQINDAKSLRNRCFFSNVAFACLSFIFLANRQQFKENAIK